MPDIFNTQSIVLNCILILTGAVLLTKSSSVLVDSAVSFARKLEIRPVLIASIVIAFATSLSEVLVNAVILSDSSISDSAIAGNVLGSNMINIGLALGIPALFIPLTLRSVVIEKELPVYLGITALVSAFVIDKKIDTFEGIILLLSFVVFLVLYYQYSIREKNNKAMIEDYGQDVKINSMDSSWVKILVPLAGAVLCLLLSSVLLVSSTEVIADKFNLSDYFIGVTLLAIVTSLPEIITSMHAIRKNHADLVIGSVIGSNIFNFTVGFGLFALINTINLSQDVIADVQVLNFFNLLTLFLILLQTIISKGNRNISRIGGVCIISLYLFYILTKIV